MKETINYLKKLTSIVSPTGYTKEIGDYLVEEVEKLGYKAVRANKGGVNITVSFGILELAPCPTSSKQLNIK